MKSNLLIEAAAGTGKTTRLIAEIVGAITNGGARVPAIAVLTFTEKAAGELKLRLRTELESAQGAAAADAILQLEEARVSTIHTFCADLLRERPVEARVDPAFRVLSEQESDRLLRTSVDLWLQGALADLPEGLRRFLRRKNSDPIESIRRAVLALSQWRHCGASWTREPFGRRSEIAKLVTSIHTYAELLRDSNANENLFKDTKAALLLSDEIRRRESLGDSDEDYLEAELIALLTSRFKDPRGRKSGALREAHKRLLFDLNSFQGRANADLAALLRDELRGALDVYAEQKRRLGALDFLDLLLVARDLLRDNAHVRAHFQREITHIFVDEFQDTDPIQVEILQLLAGEQTTLFLVGDPKQSIYRFRRADLAMYAGVKERMRLQQLAKSYRSVPDIQNFVNAAFRPVMTGDAAAQQAEYVPLEPHRPPLDRPAIVALPVPRPYGRNGITEQAIEESQPDVIAAYVEWLIDESGWGIQARDICLLFRRFDAFFEGDISRRYVQALESRGIPQLLVGGKSFHGREEIETMRTALSAIEWPDDELSVYATLRGSLFGITDEELFEYRSRFGRLKPFATAQQDVPEHLRAIGAALDFIASLHRSRNYRPVADTLRRLFTETRAHAGFVLRPSGKQVLANVMHLMEQARVYDESGALSFRGFVEQLIEEAEYGRTSEAPVLEEGSDGVRLMTVHKAKGLEFPVVILADITCNETHASASRYVDADLAAIHICGLRPLDLIRNEAKELERERAEAVRVAYVAATRARDLLIVPAIADERLDGKWVSVLNDALYPKSKRIKRPGFGDDATLDRPFNQHDRGDDTVKPGDYKFDGYTVTWWDSSKLRLDVPIALGIPQRELIGRDAPPGLVRDDIANYERWRAERDAIVTSASQPSIRVETAIERASRTEDVPDVEVVVAGQHRGRGLRYGTLVHAVLATVDLAASNAADVASLQGRILGATDDEVASVASLVENLIKHPLIARAARSKSIRREVPLTLTVDGDLVEGVADLAFEEDGRWTVIDFKTDAEIEGRIDMYKRQVAIYARAIAGATGRPATGILVQV